MADPPKPRTSALDRRALVVTAVYAVLGSAWIYASDRLLRLVVADASRVADLSTWKGLGFVLVTSLFLYSLVHGLRLDRTDGEPPASPEETPLGPGPWLPLAVFFASSLLIAGVGVVVYRDARDALRREARDGLRAVADLEARQVSEWLAQLQGNARRLGTDPFMVPAVEAWLSRGAPPDETAGRLQRRFEMLRRTHAWTDVALLDPRGEVRLAADPGRTLTAATLETAREAMRTREARLVDLHGAPDPAGPGQLELGFAAPLLLEAPGGPRVVGTFVFEQSASRYLFPLVQSWPLPTRTGETLIVRRDGDQVVFLNELRHRKGTALALRLPLDRSGLVAALAAQGAEGPLEGVDYRGEPVLASVRRIPGTTWAMIAKADLEEVEAPLRRRAGVIALVGAVLALATGVAVVLWWRQARSAALVRGYRADRERRALVRHYDWLTRYANDVIVLMGEDGRVLEANDRACAVYGYSREEILGADARALRVEGEGPDFDEQWRLTKERGGVVFEAIHRRKDGSTFPVEVSSRAIDVDGRSYRQAIVRDVSERQAAEAALRENEEKYRLLFSNERDAIVLFDLETGRFLEANDAFVALLGYGREELAALGPRDITGDPGGTARSLRRLQEEGFDRVGARRVRRKDGSLFWADLTLNGFVWRGRKVVSGILRDVTERRHAEERSQLWSRVLEDSAEGIVITDAAGAIVTVNKAFTEITGYPAAEAVGRNPRFLQSGQHDQAFYRALWQSLRESGHWQGEVWNRRRSGEVYPEWLSVTAVGDEEGRPTHYVGIFSDITERKQSAERIQFLASHDFLTGLPNRALLTDFVRHALANARRRNAVAGVLHINLDKFRTINDSLGHHAGDLLLQRVAERLSRCVRDGDTVARLGGDEFLILLPELARSQDAVLVAEKVLQAMRAPIEVQERELTITPSIGISLFPHDGDDAATLLQNADAAMTHAKEQGRNGYQFFTPDMNVRAFEALSMEMSLKKALERDELLLHYQPQAEATTGKLVGAEALVRWRHRDLGLVLPSAFIPIAEEHGLILPIGDWVMRTACAQVRRWLDQGLPAVPVAVNVSALQFRQAGLVERVRSALDDSGLEPRFLELELTESIVMRQAERTISLLAELREMGVSLSIDDFGTGYSSLSYLRRFPIRKLKIDQSFVRDLTTDPDAAAIAAAIASMGRSLKRRIIAEGVETPEQLDALRLLSCHEVQGFLVGRPVPLEEMTALLRRGRNLDLPGAAG